MRLIDADELKKELYQQWFMDILLTQRNSEDMFYALAQKIDVQPTAYDVDKVVKQLKELNKYNLNLADCMLDIQSHGLNRHFICLEDAIEIVKAGGLNAKTDS